MELKMLKYVKQIDTSKQFGYLDQFVITAKNSCLYKKNGTLKTGLFKLSSVEVTRVTNQYDLQISLVLCGTNEVVVEYGLSADDLTKMLIELSRHDYVK